MRSLSKILTVLLLLLCCGCGQEEETIEENIEYITPCNDTNLFSYLNEEAKNTLFEANTGSSLSDAQMKLFNAALTSMEVEDIDGNTVTLSDYDHCHLVFEIVSVFCSHCKVQITQYNNAIWDAHPELTFIQYFAVGTKEEVIDYFVENNLTRDENTVVLYANEDLLNYVLDIGVGLTPTILCFDNGVCTWAEEGVASLSDFNRFYDVAFNETFDFNTLTDTEGNSLFENRRSKEDVKADLTETNIASLELLDNDEVTPDLTYSIMGQTVDYSNLYTAALSSSPKMDYEGYEEKNVALLYLYMTGLENTDKECLNMVNKLIEKNSDLSFIAMIIEEDVSSYAEYLQYGIELNCPVISSVSSMPKDFSKIDAYNYPTVVFIESGTMTGGYSSFSSLEDFNKAKNLFIGKDSIAHLDNNVSE